MHALLILLLISLFSQTKLNAQESHKLVQMNATLLERPDAQYLAVSLKVADGWHIYWKNPGDAGTPPRFFWQWQGGEIPLVPLEWPAPKVYQEQEGIYTLGYQKLVSFFYRLKPSAQKLLAGKKGLLEGKWLVCADICIPGEGKIALTFNTTATSLQTSPQHYPLSRKELLNSFHRLPQKIDWPKELKLSLVKTGEKLALYFSLPQILINQKQTLYPFPHPLLTFQKPEFTNSSGVKIPVDWNGEYLEPIEPLPDDGIFSPPLNLSFLFYDTSSDKRQIIETSINRWVTKKPTSPSRPPTPTKQTSLALVLLLAFLGGMILNFMPCVLPVISLKLFSLIKSRELKRQAIFKSNVSYTLGVLVSFSGLALAVILLQAAGGRVGWGISIAIAHLYRPDDWIFIFICSQPLQFV